MFQHHALSSYAIARALRTQGIFDKDMPCTPLFITDHFASLSHGCNYYMIPWGQTHHVCMILRRNYEVLVLGSVSLEDQAAPMWRRVQRSCKRDVNKQNILWA